MALGVTAYTEAPFGAEASDVIAYPLGIELTTQENSGIVVIDVDVSTIGQALTSSAGTADGSSLVVVNPTGQDLTAAEGTLDQSSNQEIDVTGFDLTFNLANSTHDTLTAFGEAPFATLSPATFNIPVGVEATTGGIAGTFPLPMSLGDVAITGTANLTLTGQALSSNLGSVSITADANVQLFNGTGPEFSASGSAALSTDQAKFGASSLELDGTDDFVDSTSNINLSSTDFTVDVWIRPDNVTGYKGIWQSGTSTTEQSYLLGNQVYWTVNPSTIITTSVTVNANEWTMLSYERQGNTHRIYKNGTLEDTATTANKQDNGLFSIGKNGFGDFDGYIDEFRVSDIARYGGSSFTEPTSEFSVDSDTIALLHFDGADGSTNMINALNAEALVLTSNDGTATLDANTLVDITGEALSANLGTVSITANSDAAVTGQEMTMQENAPSVIGDANVPLTALPMTANLGTAVLDANTLVDLTGQAMTMQEGTATAPDSLAILTGIEMTMAQGSVKNIMWSEVNTGTTQPWTEVDTAA